MAGFILILFFPMLMGIGYMIAFLLFHLIYGHRSSQMMQRFGGFIHILLLAVPLTVIVVESGPQGVERFGWRLPELFALPSVVAIGLSLVMASLIGGLLFYNELFLSIGLRRFTRQLGGGMIGRVFDGGSQELVEHVPSAGSYLSASAAISFGEEFLWRGVMLYFLITHYQLGIWLALLLTSLHFGLNHYYFGIRNILLKTIDGLVWGGLMLVTSSILVPFLSHLTFQYFVWRRLHRQSMKLKQTMAVVV